MIELSEGEKLLKVAHRHSFVMLPVAFFLFLLATAPIFIYTAISYSTVSFAPGVLRGYLIAHWAWGAFAYSLWVLLLWVMFFIEWTSYYLDMLILSDRRMISIDQKGFFSREVTTLRYEQIQDVTVEMKGVIPTFLKFGLLQIETAGETRKIIIKQLNDPEAVKAIIIDRQHNT